MQVPLQETEACSGRSSEDCGDDRWTAWILSASRLTLQAQQIAKARAIARTREKEEGKDM